MPRRSRWPRRSADEGCLSAANESEPLPASVSHLRVSAISAGPSKEFRYERAAAVSAVLGRGRLLAGAAAGAEVGFVSTDGAMQRGLLCDCWSLAYERVAWFGGLAPVTDRIVRHGGRGRVGRNLAPVPSRSAGPG